MFYNRKEQSKLLSLVMDELSKVKLTDEELAVLEYFLKNISVGEIIAMNDLKRLVDVEDPEEILRSLIEKGLIERGEGCYNLASNLRRKVIKHVTF